ncbi:endonuclease/exonuclease/phosphatase family protein [Novosphingobium sp. TH158]|uniref:endonuclease/exonuclease/phosphatase family protein n=1 Tax=Novosphingobium sp. TH158 TaxID=2067455 RepID=UPI000C7A2204|nr:endonuclease/exonuclease/phosphatase family protein [Novosphingobium sp. TH158]PLK27432.1 endonuclease [Novosphingobium sp. TH158]
MHIKVASYNIHKAVGLDRRRDPDRILAVLREIDADVIALQEADLRFGDRASVLPRQAIDDHSPWKAVPLRMRPDSIGWHGNALLVRREIEVIHAEPVPLPTLEPRGAVCAELSIAGKRLLVVGMHLDLSGLRRRHQLRAVLNHIANCGRTAPAVLMGDFNQWSHARGAMREVDNGWHLLTPGNSFPTRQPVAALDRIVVSSEWQCLRKGVHHSPLAARASDHLPVFAELITA